MRKFWLRALLSLVAFLFLILAGTLWTWRHPEKLILWAIRQAEPTFRAEHIVSLSTHGLKFEGLRVGSEKNPYFIAEEIDLTWDWHDLFFEQRLGALILTRPRASLHGLEVAFPPQASKSQGSEPPQRKKKGWFSPKLDLLRINRGVVAIDNLASAQVSIPITLGADKPLEIQNLNLEKTEITAEANDILITSPYDALSPVLAIGTIRARFTWDGLLHQHIRSLQIEKPIVYLGPDLFWFSDTMQKATATKAASSTPAVPWVVDRFELTQGQLALNLNGVPNFTFPFHLESHSDVPLHLANFTELPLKNTIVIEPGDLDYPDYGVRVRNLNGFLALNLPPSDSTARNVVPTIKLDSISWNQTTATEGKGWITFDRNGIYGGLDAKAYDGHIGAGFSFLFKNLYPWTGWIYAEKVAMEPLLKTLAPDYFRLTGHLSGKLKLSAQNRDIQNADGHFELLDRGHMEIKSIDEVIRKLPADLSGFKRDAMKIVLIAFRDYDYTSGKVSGEFHPPQTRLSLHLDGKQGARHFDLSWKTEPLVPATVAETAPKPHTIPTP
jgi:hypothetical protein